MYQVLPVRYNQTCGLVDNSNFQWRLVWDIWNVDMFQFPPLWQVDRPTGNQLPTSTVSISTRSSGERKRRVTNGCYPIDRHRNGLSSRHVSKLVSGTGSMTPGMNYFVLRSTWYARYEVKMMYRYQVQLYLYLVLVPRVLQWFDWRRQKTVESTSPITADETDPVRGLGY